MEILGEGDDKFANRGFGIGFAEPGEGGGAAGGDLFPPTDGNEEMVGELPYCVWNG